MLIHVLAGLVSQASAETPATVRARPEVPELAAPATPAMRTARLSGGTGDTGAEVLLVERHELPLVRVQLWLDTAGLVASGALRPGELDALGSLWGRGTRALGPAWEREVEKLGGVAWTTCDPGWCSLVLSAPKESLAPLLALLGELVHDPALPPGELARWRRVARADWRTDWLSDAIVHERAVGRVTYPDGHPLREDRVAADFAVAPARLRAAWRTVLDEAAALVTVVGDTTLDEVLPHLEVAFGGLYGRTRWRPEARPGTAARAVLVNDTSEPAQLTLLWPSPGATHPDQPAWQLVANALVGGFAARLNLRLREREGLTYSVEGAYLEAAESGYTYVELDVDPSDVGDALRAIDEELERMRLAGPDAGELAAARSQAWTTGAADVGAAAPLSAVLFSAWWYGQPPGALLARLPRYADVSLDDARAAAARWLATPRVLVVTGDAEALYPVVQEAGWTRVEQWTWCEAVYGGRCP